MYVKMSASYATILHFYRATPNIGEGSRAVRLLLYGVNCYTTVPGLTGGVHDSSPAGYATTKFGGDLSGVGAVNRRASVAVFNSSVTIKGAVDLTTPQDNGLEVVGNSFVYVMGDQPTTKSPAFTGTAKKFGVYIHGNSCLHIAEDAGTPTLTGKQSVPPDPLRIGDISTDNVTVKSTWADIMGTPPVPLTDSVEMVTVKKYGIFP